MAADQFRRALEGMDQACVVVVSGAVGKVVTGIVVTIVAGVSITILSGVVATVLPSIVPRGVRANIEARVVPAVVVSTRL